MALTDLILFPIYVLLFHLFYSWKRKRMDDPLLKKYHRQGFWIKVAGTIAFTFFHIFITRGDTTTLYFTEGINITKLILKNPSYIKLLFSSGIDFDQNLLADSFNTGYFKSESNYFVTKLVSIFSFFAFGSYSVINLIFSMISFSGVWRLFRFFYDQYPKLHRQLALAIIYLPTFVFWSSGILKDPLCTGMLGWLTWSVYQLVIKKGSFLKYFLMAALSAYLLALLKSYILFAYLPFFILYLCLQKLKLIKKMFTKILLMGTLTGLLLLAIFLMADHVQGLLGGLALDKITESVKNTQNRFEGISGLAESSFSLGVEFDGTAVSLVKVAPAAIAATLFRPYLWESKKLSTLLSSLESLAFMIFTIYVLIRSRLKFFISIFTDPVVIYCFWYSIVFAVFVGTTTLNFGTLVRYKIPCIPFYLIALMLILDKCKKNKKQEIVPDPGEIGEANQ